MTAIFTAVPAGITVMALVFASLALRHRSEDAALAPPAAAPAA